MVVTMWTNTTMLSHYFVLILIFPSIYYWKRESAYVCERVINDEKSDGQEQRKNEKDKASRKTQEKGEQNILYRIEEKGLDPRGRTKN